MRRIVIAVMSTISGLVLLFSYHTSRNEAAAAPVDTSAGSGSSGGGASASSGSASTGSASTGSASSGSTSSSTTSYTGDEAQTRWGPVQVKITVKDGKIVSATAVEVPNGNGRDQEINDYAVPLLNQATVKAQSANIDAVSGATVTSDGYKTSLQSAVDQAHL